MANILIAGYGDIGARLSTLLQHQGHRITGLKRNPPGNTDPSINWIQADLTRPDTLQPLTADYDFVVYQPTPGSREAEAYRALYDTGLNNLLNRFESLDKQPVWLFVSSTGVYGQRDGEWVDENSPTEPATETSRWILRGEQTLLARRPDASIVRFSGIYGLGREYLLNTARRQPDIQRTPPYYTNRIHQDDCAAVLDFLIARRLAGEQLDTRYLASDDDPATMWEVICWLAAQQNCPPPNEKAPENPPDQNKRCRNDKLKGLGFRFRYPSYKEGYHALIESLKTA